MTKSRNTDSRLLADVIANLVHEFIRKIGAFPSNISNVGDRNSNSNGCVVLANRAKRGRDREYYVGALLRLETSALCDVDESAALLSNSLPSFRSFITSYGRYYNQVIPSDTK